MECPQCKKTISQDDIFCPFCANRIDINLKRDAVSFFKLAFCLIGGLAVVGGLIIGVAAGSLFGALVGAILGGFVGAVVLSIDQTGWI